MCINPHSLRDGTEIGCRECWQCKERKVLDWMGRCIAESKTATACHAITLTYGRGREGKNTGAVSHERAHVLTYSDVQKYFKRLRRNGYPCRYFAVGEYGSLKGRAHWHVIVYWLGPVPVHRLNERFDHAEWEHGHTFWKAVHSASVRYACKYLQKDLQDAEAQGHFAMSKKPPLGAKYFAERAQRFVDDALSPQDLFYGWPEARNKEGKKLKFMLGGRSAELFLQEYLIRWRGLPRPYGAVGPVRRTDRPWHYPPSDLVEEFEDKTLPERVLTDREFMAEFDERNQAQEKKRWREETEKTETELNETLQREYVTRMQSPDWDRAA